MFVGKKCGIGAMGTAAALPALGTTADVLLKATKVDGVYEKDTEKFPNARRLTRLTN